MQVNRSALRSFLIENGASESAADRAMATLEGHFRQAESGKFTFGPAPNRVEVAKDIVLATGRPAVKVAFVSVFQPYPRPEWMSEDAHGSNLRANLQASLVASQGANLGSTLGANLGSTLGANLGSTLGANLWNSLWDSLGASHGDIPWDSLRGNLWASLWISLFFYLDFILAGDDEQAAKLNPLVRLMATNPVLGEKADEPGTWLVLTA